MGSTRVFGWLVVASALDLSTSLSLHGADQQVALPARPGWLLALQLALLPVFALLVVRALPKGRSWLAQLAIPRLAKLAIVVVLGVQLLHVWFRSEHYPFSAVTMFSDYQPAGTIPATTHAVFLVDADDGPRPVSFLREGNFYFSEYLRTDYKTGWLLGTFAQSGSESTARVAAMLAGAGGRNPRLARVRLDAHDGTLQVLSELPRDPSAQRRQP